MHANRWLGPLALFSGLLISAVSAYFSIYGLAKLFTDSLIAGAIIFGVLELGKLVSASWCFRNWRIAPRTLKYFMVLAVAVTMAITSLGIFGYLSKAYTDKIAPVSIHQIDIVSIDRELTIENDRIKRATVAMNQLDRSIDKLLDSDKTERSLSARNRQNAERAELRKEIKDANTNIVALQKRKAAKETESTAVSSDLGPLSFIAKFVFDDSREAVDKAVMYMIGLLVMVFDPLAIALLLAGNFSFSLDKRVSTSAKRGRRSEITEPTPATKQEVKDYLGPGTVVQEVPEKLGEVDEVGYIDEHIEGDTPAERRFVPRMPISSNK